MEEPSEEDEILQTKVISSREVARSWKSWLAAIDAEVESLLEAKKDVRKDHKKRVGGDSKKHPRRVALWRSDQIGLYDQSWSKWWQAQNPPGDMRELPVQKRFRADLLQRS